MAWALNGSSQDIDLADNAALDVPDSDWAMAIWVKLDSSGTSFDTLYGHNSFGSATYVWWGIDHGGNNLEYWSTGGSHTATAAMPGSVDDTWSHFLVQRNGANLEQYLRGSSYTTFSPTFSAVQPAAIASIGQEGGGFARYYFQGSLGEFARWNRSFSAAEIASMGAGYSALFWPDSMTVYVPGIREYQETKAGIAVTNNSTTIASDAPPIIYPEAQILQFPPGAAPPATGVAPQYHHYQTARRA